MDLEPAPYKTEIDDKTNHFTWPWIKWLNSLQLKINTITHDPVTVVDTDSIDLTISDQELSGVVIPGGISHTALANLNSTTYTHLTETNHIDLTDGGETTLHSHPISSNDHVAATVVDSDTIDMSISGQQISAETIGLTDTITFVE